MAGRDEPNPYYRMVDVCQAVSLFFCERGGIEEQFDAARIEEISDSLGAAGIRQQERRRGWWIWLVICPWLTMMNWCASLLGTLCQAEAIHFSRHT